MSRTMTIAVFATAALLAAYVSIAQAQAQGKPATAVVEQNTDANGDIKVHDTGIVTVTPALNPVQVSAFGTFATGSRFSDNVTVYTVPADKVLVIDAVTLSSNMSAVDRLMDANFQLSFNGGSFSLYVQPVAEGIFTSTNAAIFRRTEKVTAYAGPGTQVTAFATRDGGALTSTSVLFGLAGHLVDGPR